MMCLFAESLKKIHLYLKNKSVDLLHRFVCEFEKNLLFKDIHGTLVSSASTVKTNTVYLLQPLDGSTDIIHISLLAKQHKRREEKKTETEKSADVCPTLMEAV